MVCQHHVSTQPAGLAHRDIFCLERLGHVQKYINDHEYFCITCDLFKVLYNLVQVTSLPLEMIYLLYLNKLIPSLTKVLSKVIFIIISTFSLTQHNRCPFTPVQRLHLVF